jgi:hypothetical protein
MNYDLTLLLMAVTPLICLVSVAMIKGLGRRLDEHITKISKLTMTSKTNFGNAVVTLKRNSHDAYDLSVTTNSGLTEHWTLPPLSKGQLATRTFYSINTTTR